MKDTEDKFNETTKPPSTSCEFPTREFWDTPRASKRGDNRQQRPDPDVRVYPRLRYGCGAQSGPGPGPGAGGAEGRGRGAGVFINSCMSCSMHRIWSSAHTLCRDQESGMKAGVEIGMRKNPFKNWTVSFEVWSEEARWTEERRTASRRRRRTG